MRLRDVKIGLRLNLLMISILVFAFSTLAIFLIMQNRSESIENTKEQMKEHIKNLSLLYETDVNSTREGIISGAKIIEQLVKENGELVLNSTKELVLNGVDQETNETKDIHVKQLEQNGVAVLRNNEILKVGSELTGCSSALYQKFDGGFACLAAYGPSADIAIGLILSDNSGISRSVNAKNDTLVRVSIEDANYIAYYKPLFKNGEIIGMLSVGMEDLAIQNIKSIFNNKTYFGSGYPYVVDEEGNFLVHPKSEGENIADTRFFQKMKNADSDEGYFVYKWKGRNKYQFYKHIEKLHKYAAITAYEDDIFAASNEIRNSILFTCLLYLIVIPFIISRISKRISKGLDQAVVLADSISNGNLNLNIDIDQKDEVGQLAKSLNRMASRLMETIHNIRSGANSISAASEQLSSSSEQLSQGANEQASSLEEVASTMEEMLANIQQIDMNANRAKEVAEVASNETNVVSEHTKDSLSANEDIAKKIAMINVIADQTNILSLNASVEAARAGAQGKGFAVVAAEVRKLAEISKNASNEINEITLKGVDVVKSAGEVVAKILPKIKDTSNLVQEIAAASQEQNRGAEQINNALQQLNDVTQLNASSSEEVSASANSLAQQAKALLKNVAFFKVE